MQESKLQAKTPRWLDIILDCVTIVEIGYIVYLKIDFLNKNSGAIQTIATIILICVTIFFACQNYKLERWRLLQPHSERIGKELSEWLARLSGLVLDPRNLPDEEGQEYWDIYKIENPPLYVKQHFESSYPDLYTEFLNWKKLVNNYNNELRNFVNEITTQGKEKLRIPNPNEAKWKSPYVHYKRIISFIFKKVLVPDFPDEEFSTPKGRITFENLENTNYQIEIKWRDSTVSQADAFKSIEIDNWIKSIEKEHRTKIEGFYKKFCNLLNEFRKIEEKIRARIIDKVNYAGNIEGRCDACPK